MRLPNFLIIGAMKAGTTTMYRDLLLNPRVFMPVDKEPGNLTRDEVLSPEGRRDYARHFARAAAEQVCGEASTNYTKLPDYPGVPQRAREVLGPQARLIYLVREPVSRIISHHHHSWSMSAAGPDIDAEVHQRPALIDYSRYAMQVRPWIEAFSREQVMIIRFEDYVSNRRATANEVSRFLGIPSETSRIDEKTVYNRTEGKPLRTRFSSALRNSQWYRDCVQPRLPVTLRDRMRRLLLPKAPPRPAPPRPETVRFVYDRLAGDLAELQQLLGLDGPVWLPPPASAEAPHRDDGGEEFVPEHGRP